MNDLDQLLHGARDAIAEATGPLDERALSRVRGTVRRARIRRHTVEGVGAAACVGALGVGAWFAAGTSDPVPVPPARTGTPTSGPTPTPTSTPTPTPAATPSGPVERAARIDDATVRERLLAPRTGETWTDPVEDDEAAARLLDASSRDAWTVYRVGTRGAATLFAAFDDATVARDTPLDQPAVLFEVDDAGARLVTCPSARTGDLCVDDGNGVPLGLAADVTLDEDTFYDTLTLPARIAAGGTWTFRTDASRADTFTGAYGVPWGPDEAQSHRVLVDLGPLALVLRDEATEGVPGLTSSTYAVRLPFGAYVPLTQEDLPNAAFDTITWDDGTPRTDEVGPGTVAPGAFVCLDAQVSTEAQHDPAQWREAGTTAEGERVVVPVAGGNAVSRAVRAFQEDQSFGFDESVDPGYRYPDDGSFLDAHALWAVQAPDGAWHLHLRQDAASVVYECV
ncbi:hypothetical protein KIN34_02700 [Cellulomonas sp. DKR-3]|uniref:Uncharacterized protein n=1 Tax=Cellulomonas fulva TaxID=2835530 RepID=A0ABS5TVL8_9CELL|nr:hypothetical protein [Cellulomonas fulva]MBT0993199.1 hypothetical protein [Cellulomonas fulva]